MKLFLSSRDGQEATEIETNEPSLTISALIALGRHTTAAMIGDPNEVSKSVAADLSKGLEHEK